MPLGSVFARAAPLQGSVHAGGAHAASHGREASQMHGELARPQPSCGCQAAPRGTYGAGDTAAERGGPEPVPAAARQGRTRGDEARSSWVQRRRTRGDEARWRAATEPSAARGRAPGAGRARGVWAGRCDTSPWVRGGGVTRRRVGSGTFPPRCLRSSRAVTKPTPAWRTSRRTCARTPARSPTCASTTAAPKPSPTLRTAPSTKTAPTPTRYGPAAAPRAPRGSPVGAGLFSASPPRSPCPPWWWVAPAPFLGPLGSQGLWTRCPAPVGHRPRVPLASRDLRGAALPPEGGTRPPSSVPSVPQPAPEGEEGARSRGGPRWGESHRRRCP